MIKHSPRRMSEKTITGGTSQHAPAHDPTRPAPTRRPRSCFPSPAAGPADVHRLRAKTRE